MHIKYYDNVTYNIIHFIKRLLIIPILLWKEVHSCDRFFIRENRTNKKGLVMIECVITINGERTMFLTGLKVNPNQWDATKQRVKGKNQETQIINDSLQAIHNKLYEKALELTQKGLFITADLLRDAYLIKWVACNHVLY